MWPGLVLFTALGDEMARSDFHWGAEDWEVFGPGQLKLYEKGGVLYGSDVGRTVWYFSAPAKFLGDKWVPLLQISDAPLLLS